MFPEDFVRLYSFITSLTHHYDIDVALEARRHLAALDICVVPKLQNIKLVKDEIPISQQSPYADGKAGDNRVSV
jgi:hypothetical protein